MLSDRAFGVLISSTIECVIILRIELLTRYKAKQAIENGTGTPKRIAFLRLQSQSWFF